MIKYSLRRMMVMVPVLLVASFLTFTLVSLSSNPVQNYEFNLQQTAATNDYEPEDIEVMVDRFEERYYYDRSFVERYWLWLTGIGEQNGDMGVLQGNFGPSTRSDNFDIDEEIAKRILPTLKLVMAGVIFSLGLAIVTGVVSAVRQYKLIDYVLTTIGFICLAMPTFWFAALVKGMGVSFNRSTETSFFGTVGDSSTSGTSDFTAFDHVIDQFGHLILPTIVLALTGFAAASRYQRAAMLEVMHSDYVRLARSKGLRHRTVIRRHALRTALMPMATLAPTTIILALTGSILVEVIFNWDGMGRFFSTALLQKDTFAIQAFVIFTGVLTVVGILISDILYAVLDPRIRL
ncbi:ABC transporter permease [Haloglycomyces albus]|uniref:ABC transporter permease n=1 Tax=Haloglycomyces albus TaxID=526067 RepID=UPI00046D0426|nr:ABC transporter permease [Haloglycomyces albus]